MCLAILCVPSTFEKNSICTIYNNSLIFREVTLMSANQALDIPVWQWEVSIDVAYSAAAVIQIVCMRA